MPDDWFRELQRAYVAELPAKIDAIARLAQGGDAARDELLRELHRLGGSAGSHGFGALGSVAQDWERALRAHADIPARALERLQGELLAARTALGVEQASEGG